MFRVAVALLLTALAGAPVIAAPRVALVKGAFESGGRPFTVRGIGYTFVRSLGSAPGSATPCQFARDLPLIAGAGANTVRTYEILPDNDRYWTQMLEAGGLYWLADFPLEPYYDATQSLSSQRPRILHAFRAYAARFRNEKRLIGFVFGNEVARDYSTKFGGSPDDFYALLADAAAALTEVTGKHGPLLTTAVHDPSEAARTVPGLDFWTLRAGNAAPADAPTLPVLIAEGPEAGDAAAALDERIRGAEAPHGLGGVWTRFMAEGAGGIFARTAPGAGIENVEPTPLFYRLAALWKGTFPSAWREKDGPRLERVENETAASAGSVVRISGANLTASAPPYTDEAWPLTLGNACICLENVPVRMSYISNSLVTVQIPNGSEPGERKLVFFRAGVASNPLQVRIRISADTTQGPILEVD